MDTESKGSRAAGEGLRAVGEVALERAIVLQLLRDDRERMWSRAQLRTELESEESKIDQETVDQALRRLHGEGVLGLSEEHHDI